MKSSYGVALDFSIVYCLNPDLRAISEKATKFEGGGSIPQIHRFTILEFNVFTLFRYRGSKFNFDFLMKDSICVGIYFAASNNEITIIEKWKVITNRIARKI